MNVPTHIPTHLDLPAVGDLALIPKEGGFLCADILEIIPPGQYLLGWGDVVEWKEAIEEDSLIVIQRKLWLDKGRRIRDKWFPSLEAVYAELTQ